MLQLTSSPGRQTDWLDSRTSLTILEKRILTKKEIYARVKKPTIIETIRLNRLHWFGHVQRVEENRIPKRALYMNLGTKRLRGRPRNRWQDEVREDGRVEGKSV